MKKTNGLLLSVITCVCVCVRREERGERGDTDSVARIDLPLACFRNAPLGGALCTRHAQGVQPCNETLRRPLIQQQAGNHLFTLQRCAT